MKRLHALALAMLLSVGFIATAHAQTRGTSSSQCLPLAVATAPQTPGQPLTSNDIVLTSVNGEEIARAGFEEPQQVFPATYPARSVVRSLGGNYGILDAANGTVTPLLEFEGVSSIQYDAPGFEVPDDSRFALFQDPVSLDAWLVDLESGAGLPLNEFIDESDFIIGAAIAPGDEWLAVWTGNDIVLFDFAAGSTTESLGGGDALGYPSFSSNDDTLFYLRRGADRVSIAVARDVATGIETPLLEGDDLFGLQRFPGDILVVMTVDGLYRVPNDGSSPVLLLRSEEELQPRVINATGTHILVSERRDDVISWHLVDVTGAGAIDLPPLEGSFLTTVGRQASWVLFQPSLLPRPADPGAQYTVLDLETGQAQTVLEESGDGVYFIGPVRSNDGRFATIWSLSPAIGRLWLIDAELGVAQEIGSSTGSAVGLVTPDGCSLAVGVFDTIGEGRQGSVQVIDLKTGEVTAEIADAILLGWART